MKNKGDATALYKIYNPSARRMIYKTDYIPDGTVLENAYHSPASFFFDKTGMVNIHSETHLKSRKITAKKHTIKGENKNMNRNKTNIRKAMSKAGVSAMMAVTAMSGLAVPTFAAEGTNYGTTIGGTKTTTFDKFLLMDEQANVPNATFSYAVTAGNAKAYDVAGKKFQVLAGVDANKITMAGVGEGAEANKIVFKQGDGSDEHDTTKDAYVKDLAEGKKYALKTATLDFSAVQFTEPGVYRYVITESGTNQAITNDADLTRILDVYVNDDSTDVDGTLTKKLTIAGYVLHSSENDEPDVAAGADFGSTGAYVATKSQGFTNSYDTSDLTLRKQVTGNQASRDKYFEFTLNIDKAQPNTKYDVVIDDADATSKSNAATIQANAGQTNVTSITTDGAGKATQKFYLQHGQQVTVQGLAKDTTYAVTENAEDYKSTANTADAPVVDVKADTDSAEVNGTIASKDLTTGYLNTRNGVIPTGVIMAVAPFAVVTILGGAGVVTMVMKKNKKEDE